MKRYLIPSFLILFVLFYYSFSTAGTLKCSLCGKEITGQYMIYPDIDLNVCEQCEKTKPRCEKCNVPANRLTNIGGHNFCERCAQKVNVCRSCGEALMGEYFFFDGNEALKYCQTCTAKYPKCADCGAPSGPNGTRLNDGRYLCPDCRRIAYFDSGLVTAVKLKALSFVENAMGMKIKHEISYSLQNRDYIQKKIKGLEGDLNGLFYRKGNEFDIYVLYGLREQDLLSVLSHEITHAWEAENCSDELPLEDQEGFAQWVAYKALVHYSREDAAHLMVKGDNIYCRGLNHMLRIEDDGGPKAVFDFIKRKKI